MRRVVATITVGLLGISPIQAGAPDDQKEKKHSKYQQVVDRQGDRTLEVHVVFSRQEARAIREHYAPVYYGLPPGLQKKLARTGRLPKGWEKRMEPFPVVVERQLTTLPVGYRRGVIDGHAVIYNPTTQGIIDVTVLF
jgi:hypothetical protein